VGEISHWFPEESMLSLQRTTRKPQVAGGTVSDIPKSTTMDKTLVNGAVKVAVGTAMVGAGVVLQTKGLATLGKKDSSK